MYLYWTFLHLLTTQSTSVYKLHVTQTALYSINFKHISAPHPQPVSNHQHAQKFQLCEDTGTQQGSLVKYTIVPPLYKQCRIARCHSLSCLQIVQNAAARLLTCTKKKRQNITHVLIHRLAPPYITDLLTPGHWGHHRNNFSHEN